MTISNGPGINIKEPGKEDNNKTADSYPDLEIVNEEEVMVNEEPQDLSDEDDLQTHIDKLKDKKLSDSHMDNESSVFEEDGSEVPYKKDYNYDRLFNNFQSNLLKVFIALGVLSASWLMWDGDSGAMFLTCVGLIIMFKYFRF